MERTIPFWEAIGFCAWLLDKLARQVQKPITRLLCLALLLDFSHRGDIDDKLVCPV